MQNHILDSLRNPLAALLIGCLSVVLGCRTQSGYPVFPIPFPRNELVGSWVGLNCRDGTFYRLDLLGTEDGVLYTFFEEGSSMTNTISRWSIGGNKLRCEFGSQRVPTDPLSLTCEINGTRLLARLMGVGGWKESILFRPLRSMENTLSKVRAVEGNN
jgi:hypothetical protein